MKIPKAEKLPSGAYRVRVMLNGKSMSFTDKSEKQAIKQAVNAKADAKIVQKPLDMTVGAMIDAYIESKDGVLSPSTIAGYKRIRKNQMQDLMPLRTSELTMEKVQRIVSKMAKEKSPKTVKNAYGLFTAALGEFRKDLTFDVTLPQKQRVDIIIPSDADVDGIMKAVRGKSVELPVLLAMWLGLRMSEIRGLTWDCIEGDTLHIRQAMVDEGLKGTKTYSSDRRLPLPPEIKSLIEARTHDGNFIIPDSRRAIASRFDYWTEQAGLKHYRFHDLRHVNASVMLQLGVPDKYAMQRMGHATNNMLKTVYQHTMPEKQKTVSETVDNYFRNKFATNFATKQEKR